MRSVICEVENIHETINERPLPGHTDSPPAAAAAPFKFTNRKDRALKFVKELTNL